jgi:hypothetical protein
MMDSHGQQMERETAFNKYKSEFTISSCNIFEVLYNKLTTGIEITKQVLGEYFFEKYVLAINDNLENIEATVTNSIDLIYCENQIEYGSFFHFKPLLEKRINELIGPQQPGTVKFETTTNKHPQFDPNLWNNDCFELFKYLFDNYHKRTKRQLTNVWFYLKGNGNSKYNFNATKDQYKDFMLNNYKIKITNFEKALMKWEDKEYNTIDDHRINFEDTLK